MIQRISRYFSDRNRIKKYNLFISELMPIHTTRILDVGASENEYQKNANILEKLYPHQEMITVLGIDDYKEFNKRYPKVKTIHYNGKTFPFKDNEFDVCWSNAVIEHVGDKEAQTRFIKEIARTSKHALITTPNRFFPMEVHTKTLFLQYLQKPVFDKLLTMFGKGWATGKYMNLLSLSSIEGLLAAAGVKKYKIIKNKFLFFTIDFVIIF